MRDTRTKNIRIRLTPDEKRTIDAKARRLGMDTSTFLRFLALNANVERGANVPLVQVQALPEQTAK